MTPDFSDTTSVTANILAGGRARRMQGEDKGLILLENKPMIAYVIERLAPQVESIWITANRHLEEYNQFGRPVIRDTLADFPGPLAGFLTAFINIKSDWILNVPCDTPFLPEDLLQRLASAIQKTGKNIAVASTLDGLQPTFCLVHRSLQNDLQTYLEQGGRKTGDWILNNDPAIVEYADHTSGFANINTYDELDDAQQHFK